jgi:hypothetical protein
MGHVHFIDCLPFFVYILMSKFVLRFLSLQCVIKMIFGLNGQNDLIVSIVRIKTLMRAMECLNCRKLISSGFFE